MPSRQVTVLIGFCLLCPGCNLAAYSTRNFVLQPLQTVDNCCMCKQNKALAHLAWEKVKESYPEEYSGAYAHGFKKGFADYLDAGGTGQPPPLPPWWYRTTLYQSPQGHETIEQWYAGFRHGAELAQMTDLRQNVVIPLSRPFDPDRPLNQERPGGFSGSRARPDTPTLPVPRPLPDKTGTPVPAVPPEQPPGGPLPEGEGEFSLHGAPPRDELQRTARKLAPKTCFGQDRVDRSSTSRTAGLEIRSRAKSAPEAPVIADLGPPVAVE